MENVKRLIELDFPLEQVSLDSVHEKNVRHGHISTLHIWPARRPLAACRAALIATLLPDPGNAEEREAIYRRLAGEVVETIEEKKVNGKTVEKRKRETRGGILHWGRESGPDLEWFREEIRKAYGGRAPRVLDPFAGGGAIPLEAMRLGCEATAIDINPVAWFILKCTLEYPQKLAGQTRPLPDFVLKDRDFMEAFLKAKCFKGVGLKRQLAKLGLDGAGAPAEPQLVIPSPAMRERVARRANGEPGEGDSGTVSDRPLTPTLSPVGGEGVSSHDPLLDADLAWQGARLGPLGVGGGAQAPRASLSNLRRVPGARTGRSALREAPVGAARTRRERQHRCRAAERCFPESLSRRSAQPALGREADGRLSLGAHGALQGLPRDDPAAEDALARQEGQQARLADDDTERRTHRRRLRRRDQRPGGGRQCRAAARA